MRRTWRSPPKLPKATHSKDSHCSPRMAPPHPTPRTIANVLDLPDPYLMRDDPAAACRLVTLAEVR